MKIKDLHLVAFYVQKPRPGVQTQIAGWNKNPDNYQYDERIEFTRGLSSKDQQYAGIILNLAKKTVVHNRYNAQQKDFDSLFKYFLEGYPQYVAQAMAELDVEYLKQFIPEEKIKDEELKAKNKKYGNQKKPGTLLDPFMGGGSTIVEGYMNGYRCIGSDISRFSTFITSAKVNPVKIENRDCLNIVKKIKKKLSLSKLKIKIPNISNIDKWFRKDKLKELLILKEVAESLKNKKKRNFFLLAISSILRSCSNAKNAQQHLNIQKIKKLPNTLDIFEKKIYLMKNQMGEYIEYLKNKKNNKEILLLSTDVRELSKKIEENSVDIVITSPPYGTGSRYTDIYRLHFEFFEIEKPKLKGSLEKNKDFNEELKKGFSEIYKVLKKNSYFICVYGDPSTEESITDKAIKNCQNYNLLNLLS
jgi:hypothetical protein